ncbi:MAG TPA: hypothetical protein VKV40_15690 [Ktedonobacteraceae bacterium]|nr:hypothetical protein [Ktedonobacteraceae bacterium]
MIQQSNDAQKSKVIAYREFFRKTHDFDDRTARSKMPVEQKEQLARFILESNDRIKQYFEVVQRADSSLESFTNDFIPLKGRKI